MVIVSVGGFVRVSLLTARLLGRHRKEMHLTLNMVLHIKQTFFSFSYDFMFDRIICVLVRIKVRGHLVMSIIQFMNLISVHFSGHISVWE